MKTLLVPVALHDALPSVFATTLAKSVTVISC